MATVVLQTIGATVGSAVAGPFGAIVGRAAGALAGSVIDQQLYSKDRVVEGPRLESTRLLTSTEGTPVPRVYGRNRISGQIIWATRFEEQVTEEGGGGSGKGGPPTPTTRTYSYFANFAVAICEGPIAGVRRMWADAQELDLNEIDYRVYEGSTTQRPDPLINAKQGTGNVPAYRDTAYVVFDSFPLEKYGNRIPQISFEIIRPVGKLENDIRSISVIPGATEYGYDPQKIEVGGGSEQFKNLNRHNSITDTDWQTSIDELQMLCPRLQSVSLVVAWYGTDLRAANCDIRPGVTQVSAEPWSIANFTRQNAHLVSRVGGRSAYGGTPTDISVTRAIQDLKSRGLKVVFYPFLMMDIPRNNNLPWIDGETGQPAYPWRGEISCYPRIGQPNTADKKASARNQLAAFSSQYNKMILHYADLCANSGGVDGFLIGSELRSLTRVRDNNGKFPFVENLQSLASSTRAILGSDCKLSYGADWTEYFGYQPPDGSGDVLFNLDPLWAMPAIDAVGIDNYMPLSDWNAGKDLSDPQARSVHDVAYLESNMAANEGFDWYYASERDRNNQVRTPITDGAEGEPWVFRYKDLQSWWSNRHHNRLRGRRQTQPTSWVPQSKPFWMTEIGCPAIDKGSNQPNVFFDEKSDQSAIPYHSTGARDDLIQRRCLEAQYNYWKRRKNNPISARTGAPMLSTAEITPWTWDARPFPWFPVSEDIWSDGANWHVGHWLTGRLGGCPVDDLIRQILSDFGFTDFEVKADGIIDGYSIPGVGSAREALEPLLQIFGIHVAEQNGKLVFQSPAYSDRTQIEQANLVQENEEPARIKTRKSETELPAETVVQHFSIFSAYEDAASKSRRLEGGSDRQITLQTGMVMSESKALELAEIRLRRDWGEREELQVRVSNRDLAITPGDVVTFGDGPDGEWLVETIERGEHHQIGLRSLSQAPVGAAGKTRERGKSVPILQYGKPEIVLMDLPLLRSADSGKYLTHIAVSADPWARNYSVHSSPGVNGFTLRDTVQRQAVTGYLLSPLAGGVSGRWDRATTIHLNAGQDGFLSKERLLVLNGQNVLAVECTNGGMELVQFQSAELQEDGSWKLSNLLRGQLGSEPEMLAGAQAGARIVLLDSKVAVLEMEASEIGLDLNWRIGPAGLPISSTSFASHQFANGGRSRRMLSPVHLYAKKSDQSDILYSWKRRSRIDADNWENAEIPLDAQHEAYRIKIFDAVGDVKRETTVESPEFHYVLADRVADLGSSQAEFDIHVAQIGDNGLPGSPAVLTGQMF